MDKGLPIRIQRVRGHLPPRYQPDLTFQQKLRVLAYCLTAGALFWGGVWYWASR
jgi:hypothetical protein